MRLSQVPLLLVVGGLVLLGAEWWEDRGHPSRHKVPAEAELLVISGNVLAARVLTSKTKKGVLASRYYELDVQAPGGVSIVRIPSGYPEQTVSSLIGETLTAKVDARENNAVYSLGTERRELISYQQSAADKAVLVKSNSGGYTTGWVVLALGLVGWWFMRRRSE